MKKIVLIGAVVLIICTINNVRADEWPIMKLIIITIMATHALIAPQMAI